MSIADREAPRVAVTLDVFLQTVDGDVPCETRDASYDGVFIVRQKPLPLRKLIRFRTRLPESGDELQMLGLVAHTVNRTDAAEKGSDPGMGIQLFSLGSDTRRRWRKFIDDLYQKNPEARRSIEEKRRPKIRVRIPNLQMLTRFRTVDLPKQELFVRTPDLHPEQTAVDCVVTHPETGDEFVLDAEVVDCVEGTVKERGLRLHVEIPEDRDKLEAFVGGEIPAESAPPAAPPQVPGGDTEESDIGDEESYAEEELDDKLANEPADEPSDEPSDEPADAEAEAQEADSNDDTDDEASS